MEEMMKKSLKGLAVGASLVMALGLLAGCGGEKKAAGHFHADGQFHEGAH